jgi:hypothetical protein
MDSVVGAECYFDIRMFEQICDVCGFFSYVCENSPFLGGVELSCVWVSVRCLGCICGLMGKELLCRMLWIMFYLSRVLDGYYTKFKTTHTGMSHLKIVKCVRLFVILSMLVLL